MTETIDRPVRVTIEGTAHKLGSESNPVEVLRVKYAGGSVVIVPGHGVTVEDIEPPRVWTDGDVVQIDTGRVLHTYTRNTALNGDWCPWESHADSMSDAGMTDYVTGAVSLVHTQAEWSVRVLRYQAGE